MKTSKTPFSRMVVPISIGVVAGWVVTILMSLLGTVLIHNEKIGLNQSGWLGFAISYLATFVGAIGTACMCKEEKMIAIGVVGAVYYISELCITYLLFDDVNSNILGSIIPCAIATFVVILMNKTKRKHNNRRHRFS